MREQWDVGLTQLRQITVFLVLISRFCNNALREGERVYKKIIMFDTRKELLKTGLKSVI